MQHVRSSARVWLVFVAFASIIVLVAACAGGHSARDQVADANNVQLNPGHARVDRSRLRACEYAARRSGGCTVVFVDGTCEMWQVDHRGSRIVARPWPGASCRPTPKRKA